VIEPQRAQREEEKREKKRGKRNITLSALIQFGIGNALLVYCKMDSIQLTGICCYGYTGYLPEEQVLGQRFEVDVTLWLDLSKAGKSDDIEHTLDYRSAITLIQQLVTDSKFLLIERLADTIAEALLQLPLVEQVKLQLSKPAAPIPDFGGKITLEITRTKNSN
jgi:7,8-dihydroneopterin aldolase/epimerase/oxygenase